MLLGRQKDRPGLVQTLVQTLAQVIADHLGNWIDSSMARLGGEFAGILRVDVSERTVASFEKSLAALAERGIAVTAPSRGLTANECISI